MDALIVMKRKKKALIHMGPTHCQKSSVRKNRDKMELDALKLKDGVLD